MTFAFRVLDAEPKFIFILQGKKSFSLELVFELSDIDFMPLNSPKLFFE
jgi:hypothetical protein